VDERESACCWFSWGKKSEPKPRSFVVPRLTHDYVFLDIISTDGEKKKVMVKRRRNTE
jgi:hypothetical protein